MAALALLEDIIPLCPKCITCPYSAQEQRNVKNRVPNGFSPLLRTLRSPLQYSTCPCAVGSGAQHRHAEGKLAMFGCIGRETAIGPRKGLPDHPSLLCATQHLSKPWHRGEDEMRMDQDDHPPIPAGWNKHITALRRLELIHQLYQQVNNVDKNKCTHDHIFFRMFYLGTFVQRTLNSGQSSATTSLTDSFKSLCE